jgi:hypothetical protein
MAINSDPSNLRLKDFAHGQKLFGVNQNRLSPKYSFLYHVYFEINPAASNAEQTMYKGNSDHIKEVGMLVKSVDLPKFEVETKDFNAYNQRIPVQTGIKYNPVKIDFHDDSANIVRNFWEDYMTYYYADAYNSNDVALAMKNNRYSPAQRSSAWGFDPRATMPYLKSVKIYSMSMDQYSLYTLVNPTITSWTHGTHVAGQNEFIGHSMALKYEYVRYEDGDIQNLNQSNAESLDTGVLGLSKIHYDPDRSELTKDNRYINSIRGLTQKEKENLFPSTAYARAAWQINLTEEAEYEAEARKYRNWGERQYGAAPRSPAASTLGSRLRASIARAGQSVINSTIIKAENRLRNTKIGNATVNSILQPALQNTVSRSAAGLSDSLFPSPRKD